MIAEWFLTLPLLVQALAVYLAVINIVTFFYFGFDKMRSQVAGARRVSERTLWLLTLIGGSGGALGGMHFFRHKTKKLSFQAVIALILAVQVVAVIWLFR